MRKVVPVLLTVVLLTACSSGGGKLATSPTAQASPAIGTCDQLQAVVQLTEDHETGAFMDEELIPRYLALRDWFWAESKRVVAAGEDRVVDKRAYKSEDTAAYKLTREGDILGEVANGSSNSIYLNVFTAETLKNFKC